MPPVIRPPVQENIEETTVGLLAGVRVPMGNMTRGSYVLPDGRAAVGLICALAIPGGAAVFVGEGSEVEVGGVRWRVVGIEKRSGELGSVTLEKL